MKQPLLIVIIFLSSYLMNFSQQYIAIDTVISFASGSGQNSGQSSEFFPKNIFGLPSRFTNINVPTISEEEICSLGLNGEITVSFKDYLIVDNSGNDFYIYEN